MGQDAMTIRRRIGRSIPALARKTQTRTSNLVAAFDADWYCATYPEVRATTDPLGHYLAGGWQQGFNPCPLFDSSWYAEQNPDAIAAGINPLAHYVDYGWEEGRDPSPLFSTEWYLNQFSGRARWSPDPMTHYRHEGWRMGIDPHSLFDVDWYLIQLATAEQSAFEGDPLAHYLTTGWDRDLDPNPMFDSSWYLDQHPDLRTARTNPLVHYVSTGAARGADPSALFSTTGYAAKYPHCGGRAEALAHYLEYGRREGLTLVFSESAERTPHSINDVQVSGALPAPDRAPSIAIIAAHDQRGSVGLAVRHLCSALSAEGISVVLTYDHPVETQTTADDPWVAIVSANHAGYDFFSWRLALEQFAPDAAFDEIFLLNDSIIGPFGPIDDLLATWRALPFNVTGLVESSDPRAHLQSWGLRFSGRAATPANLLSLYGRAQSPTRKGDAIDFLEIPLTEHFRTRGFTSGSIFSQATVSSATRNPAIYGWRELLASGLPFVKREVLTLPEAVIEQRKIDVLHAVATLLPQAEPETIIRLANDSLAQVNRAPLD